MQAPNVSSMPAEWSAVLAPASEAGPMVAQEMAPSWHHLEWARDRCTFLLAERAAPEGPAAQVQVQVLLPASRPEQAAARERQPVAAAEAE
jgi:hypothetical protein